MKFPTKTDRARIKLMFLAVILWMPLQYLVTARYGEPYPALAMPSFAGTLIDRGGNIRIANVGCKVLLRSGAVAWTSAYDLLSEAPSAYHDLIMTHMFGPAPTKPPALRAGRFTALLFTGRILGRYRQAQKKLDPQTKDWLRSRMEALYPSQRVTEVTFVWYAQIFNLKQVPPT